MIKNQKLLSAILAGFVMFAHANLFAEDFDNQSAIGELTQIKGIYDIRHSDPKELSRFLAGIKANINSLEEAGVESDLVIAFMSAAVRFIHTDPNFDFNIDHTQALQEIKEHVSDLRNLGVRMEVCSTATRRFGIDNTTLLDGIEPVRSGFITLMGYQNNGYALVTIYD